MSAMAAGVRGRSSVVRVREGAAGGGEGAAPRWGRAADFSATHHRATSMDLVGGKQISLMLYGSCRGMGEGHRICRHWGLPVGEDAVLGGGAQPGWMDEDAGVRRQAPLKWMEEDHVVREGECWGWGEGRSHRTAVRREGGASRARHRLLHDGEGRGLQGMN